MADNFGFLGVYNVSDTIVDQAGSSRYYKDTIRYGGGNKIIFNGYSLDYSQTYLSGKFANYNSNDIDIPLQGNDKSYDPTIIGKGKWLGYGFEILYTRKINGIVENRRAYYNKIAD